MRHVRDANDRDAEYLACQMYTNSRVLGYQTRMQRAKDRLHMIFLEVAELDDAGVAPVFHRPVVEAPLPPLDRMVSTPRTSRTISGTVPTASALAQISSDPPVGLYAFASKPKG